ncbi:MAG: Trk system potassium transporter TrkA [Ruminococcaceae bacterium]|nr:Trk system potassium transporter TrkA [Oscillospiraceae bacterium]
MKIVIIGGGMVGSTIAAQLTNEGHDITVVDRHVSVADRISDSLDCMALAGNGASLELMRSADVPSSDLLIACTAQDELNMLCCVFAKKLGCRSAIARVRTPEYADQMYYFKEELGMSMTINPELNAAREMFKLLEIPGVLKRDSFAKGRVEIVEVVPKTGDMLDGTRLMDLQRKLKCRVLVGAVQRDGEVIIPDGSFTLRAGDKVSLCAPTKDLVSILHSIGEDQKKAKNIMLIGCSKVTDYLCFMLLGEGANVRVIESDPALASAFAERYSRAEVVCADGRSEAVLREENAAGMDAAVTLTESDEENLILSMYLSSVGVPQVLTKVDNTEFGNLLASRGDSRIISPKKLCADAIVRYVRAMQNTEGSGVITLHHLVDGQVDALEFQVTDSCRYVGKKLLEMHFKPNTRLACINRMGRIIIPGGGDTLEAGDTVVVIAAANRVILDLNDVFAGEE